MQDGSHHFLRCGRQEAQHGKGGYRLVVHLPVGSRKRQALRRTGLRTYAFDFIFQVHNDALGSLQADAFHALKQAGILRADVEQAAGALASLLRDGTLVVGFMQNSWLEEFKAAVAQRVDGCRLETVTAYADGVSLFVLSSDKWVLRESASEEEGAYMVSDLQVEQLY